MDEKRRGRPGAGAAGGAPARDMGRGCALLMGEVNARFYREQAASFSGTRRAAWPGWRRCLADAGLDPGPRGGADGGARPGARPGGGGGAAPLRVLDVACGNLRLARFLASELPGAPVRYRGVDSCPGLARGWEPPAGWDASLVEADLVRALLDGDGRALDGALGGAGEQDLVACFGFLHHVPTFSARLCLLRALVSRLAPGGACCVSLWRFLSDPGLAARARRTTEEAASALGLAAGSLGEGDCLLGWQGAPGAWRYCHDFGDEEVDALVAGLGGAVEVLDRFLSDGRTGSLNAYLVLGRR